MVLTALGMNKCVQAEKRVIPRTEHWATTTFRRRNEKGKNCQRIRENPGDTVVL